MKRPRARRPKFHIGDPVYVKATTDLLYDGNERKISQERCGKTGWIVGARRRHYGVYRAGGGGSGPDWDSYEDPYLEIKGTILVWLVATSLMNHPLEAMEDDLQLVFTNERTPWRNGTPWPKEEKTKILASIPRDPKGRFC